MVTIRLLAPVAVAVALLPAAVFLLDRGELFIAMALVNVLLIAGCVYLLLSPHEEDAATPT